MHCGLDILIAVRSAYSLILLAIFGTAVHGQPVRPAGMNSAVLSQIPPRMQHFIDDKTVAGAVTLVARGSDVNEFDALGMADIEANHAMQKDSIFQIMSMTKPFTAVGIMMLAEEGKLALRDPVEQYLPEFHNQRVAVNV